MTGHGAKFPRKMEEAIAALLTRPSIEEAARVLPVEPKTLRRWMREPEFQKEYLLARRESVSQAIARAQQNVGAAVTTTLKLMVDQATPASVRLRASEHIVNISVKGVEVEDVEARVSELERAAEAAKNSGRK